MRRRPSRRAFVAAAVGAATVGLCPPAARAAAFVYKFGHVLAASDPWNVWAVQMAAAVKRETQGRMEIDVYPNSVLGSDVAILQQARMGAIQFAVASGAQMASLVPAAGIQAVPYAFATQAAAVGAHLGDLGAAVRGQIEATMGFHVFPIILPSGFRQVTSGTRPIRVAGDFAGFKIRTITSSILVDFYKTFDAQVLTLSVGEVYAALQTHLADGQDSAYGLIETMHLYEVQKYLSIMNAIWAGAYFFCNGDAWRALPADIQAVVAKQAGIYGAHVVRDVIASDSVLVDKLHRQGMTIYQTDRESFESRLGPLYTKLKAGFGPAMWALLEKVSGPLG